MNLPVPQFKLVSISQELIEIEDNLNNIQQGVHFGCEYLSKAVDFVGQNMLKNVINKSDIAGVLAFDFWVGNDDRTSNNGNLLINQESSTISKLIMIDHTHCFTDGPYWMADDLIQMSQVGIIPLDGDVYCQLVQKIDSQECFESWLLKIESFDDNIIKEIINDVPNQWGLKENEKEALFSYLSLRKSDVRPAIMSQKDKFSKWKVVN